MKAWLIIALVFVIVGGVMFAGALASTGWDFLALSTVKYETVEHGITEEFKNITINTSTADVTFATSEQGEVKVVCYEAENANHEVSVVEGVLTVREIDERRWYDHIGISIGSPKITVYLPAGEYGSLSVENSTGKVELPGGLVFAKIDVSTSTGEVRCAASSLGELRIKTTTGEVRASSVFAETLSVTTSTGRVALGGADCTGITEIKVSTGDVDVRDVNCGQFTSTGSTGDVNISGLIVSGKMSITRSTGDVEFERCDAAEISIKTTTGEVEGSLLSEKIFVAKSSTGDVEVPRSTSGGLCEVTTSTGDIEIDVIG